MQHNLTMKVRVYDHSAAADLIRFVAHAKGLVVEDCDDKTLVSHDRSFLWKTGRFLQSQVKRAALFPNLSMSHFPSSAIITKKDTLLRYIRRMINVHGSLYNFTPLSFVLPSEFTKLAKEMARDGGCKVTTFKGQTIVKSMRSKAISGISLPPVEKKKKKQKKKNGKSSKKPKGNDKDSKFQTEGSMFLPSVQPRTWICKPADSSRGRDIFLFEQLTDLEYQELSVVQEYISNPLLIKNYKFDLRVYVLVTSTHPLRVYIYDQGLARFSTDEYKPLELNNLYSHLTNASINKFSPFLNDDKHGLGAGCKRTFEELEPFLNGHSKQAHRFWPLLCHRVVLTLLAMPLSGPSKKISAFELFGFDFLLDDKYSPLLLEVNHAPALGIDSYQDAWIKTQLVCDVMKTVELDHHYFGAHTTNAPPLPINRGVRTSQSSQCNNNLNNNNNAATTNSNNIIGVQECEDSDGEDNGDDCGLNHAALQLLAKVPSDVFKVERRMEVMPQLSGVSGAHRIGSFTLIFPSSRAMENAAGQLALCSNLGCSKAKGADYAMKQIVQELRLIKRFISKIGTPLDDSPESGLNFMPNPNDLNSEFNEEDDLQTKTKEISLFDSTKYLDCCAAAALEMDLNSQQQNLNTTITTFHSSKPNVQNNSFLSSNLPPSSPSSVTFLPNNKHLTPSNVTRNPPNPAAFYATLPFIAPQRAKSLILHRLSQNLAMPPNEQLPMSSTSMCLLNGELQIPCPSRILPIPVSLALKQMSLVNTGDNNLNDSSAFENEKVNFINTDDNLAGEQAVGIVNELSENIEFCQEELILQESFEKNVNFQDNQILDDNKKSKYISFSVRSFPIDSDNGIPNETIGNGNEQFINKCPSITPNSDHIISSRSSEMSDNMSTSIGVLSSKKIPASTAVIDLSLSSSNSNSRNSLNERNTFAIPNSPHLPFPANGNTIRASDNQIESSSSHFHGLSSHSARSSTIPPLLHHPSCPDRSTLSRKRKSEKNSFNYDEPKEDNIFILRRTTFEDDSSLHSSIPSALVVHPSKMISPRLKPLPPPTSILQLEAQNTLEKENNNDSGVIWKTKAEVLDKKTVVGGTLSVSWKTKKADDFLSDHLISMNQQQKQQSSKAKGDSSNILSATTTTSGFRSAKNDASNLGTKIKSPSPPPLPQLSTNSKIGTRLKKKSGNFEHSVTQHDLDPNFSFKGINSLNEDKKLHLISSSKQTL